MPMNQEAISRGRGLLEGIRPKQSPCSAGVLPGLCIWKNQYPRYSPALGGTRLQMNGALIVVSYKRKYVHKVLVYLLIKLAQEKSVVIYVNRPSQHAYMTII